MTPQNFQKPPEIERPRASHPSSGLLFCSSQIRRCSKLSSIPNAAARGTTYAPRDHEGLRGEELRDAQPPPPPIAPFLFGTSVLLEAGEPLLAVNVPLAAKHGASAVSVWRCTRRFVPRWRCTLSWYRFRFSFSPPFCTFGTARNGRYYHSQGVYEERGEGEGGLYAGEGEGEGWDAYVSRGVRALPGGCLFRGR